MTKTRKHKLISLAIIPGMLTAGTAMFTVTPQVALAQDATGSAEQMPPLGAISGGVYWDKDGSKGLSEGDNPIANKRVVVQSQDPEVINFIKKWDKGYKYNDFTVKINTDDNGTFFVRNLPPGKYVITVEGVEGSLVAKDEQVVVSGGSENKDVNWLYSTTPEVESNVNVPDDFPSGFPKALHDKALKELKEGEKLAYEPVAERVVRKGNFIDTSVPSDLAKMVGRLPEKFKDLGDPEYIPLDPIINSLREETLKTAVAARFPNSDTLYILPRKYQISNEGYRGILNPSQPGQSSSSSQTYGYAMPQNYLEWSKVSSQDTIPLTGSEWTIKNLNDPTKPPIRVTDSIDRTELSYDLDSRPGYFRVKVDEFDLPKNWQSGKSKDELDAIIDEHVKNIRSQEYEYEISEVKAPDGYQKLETPITVTVAPGSDGNLQIGEIENDPISSTPSPAPVTETTRVTVTATPDPVTKNVTTTATPVTVTQTKEVPGGKTTVVSTIPGEPIRETETVPGKATTVTQPPVTVTDKVEVPGKDTTVVTTVPGKPGEPSEPMSKPNSGPAFGSVTGTVVWDNDGSRNVNEGDKPVPGQVVVLKRDDKEVTRTLTDGNGFYEFPGLEPGKYSIEVIGPDGAIKMFDDKEATVKSGETDANNDWGYSTSEASKARVLAHTGASTIALTLLALLSVLGGVIVSMRRRS